MAKQSSPWIYWRVFSILALSVLGPLVYWWKYMNVIDTVRINLPSRFLVDTKGCRILDYDPFDPSVRRFLFDEEDPGCEETYGPPLVGSDATTLFINKSALVHYNVRDAEELMCRYTPFRRDELQKQSDGNYPEDVDSRIRFASVSTPFTDRIEITDEFVKVQCFLKSAESIRSIYTDFHAFVPSEKAPKREVFEPTRENSVSVMILGVDSVSRLNLYRQMPLTVDFLKNTIGAVEFVGFNKVADNTFPNVIPILTGFDTGELKRSCWPSANFVFDNCSFVWDRFHEAGHTTAFAEDAYRDLGIFTHTYPGFRNQPTDFYPRPFFLQADSDIGFSKKYFFNLCLGPRKTLEVLLNYALKFAYAMRDALSFTLVWGCSLTHDFLNLPKQGDVDHREFLEKLYGERILNRTVLLFMSDHGIRFGRIRQTYQGYVEERLPFLFVSCPDWWREKFGTAFGNLKNNAKRLTTPFDLHETLLDLVNLTRLETEVLRERSEKLRNAKSLPRGISLFLPISKKRTCDDAGISDYWCTCGQSSSISTDAPVVKSAANHIVDQINNYLLGNRTDCARLSLSSVTNARKVKARPAKTFKTSDGGLTDYTVTLETVPGDAMFESTVRHNENTNNFTIIGIISRINFYGNQSVCISHSTLQMYCYCTL